MNCGRVTRAAFGPREPEATSSSRSRSGSGNPPATRSGFLSSLFAQAHPPHMCAYLVSCILVVSLLYLGREQIAKATAERRSKRKWPWREWQLELELVHVVVARVAVFAATRVHS